MSNKKERKEKEKQVKKLKAQQQAYEKEKTQYKLRVRPLVQFLRKHKLPFNNAHVGTQRVEYFRLDDFQKLLKDKSEQIQANENLKKLVKKAYSEFIFFKRPENIKSKYPNALHPVKDDSSEKKYASFRFDTTESKRKLTIFVISLVLMVVLFPIWPFTVKYGLWVVSLTLLVLLVGILVVRLIIYIIFAIFNYHVWIFPNILYSNGIVQCFVPVIECSKGDRSWFNMFIRLFAVSFFILCCLHIYLNPTFFDQTIDSTKAAISDVHDWGVEKIKNQGNFSQRALTNLDTILNETANVELSGDTQVLQNSENVQEVNERPQEYENMRDQLNDIKGEQDVKTQAEDQPDQDEKQSQKEL